MAWIPNNLFTIQNQSLKRLTLNPQGSVTSTTTLTLIGATLNSGQLFSDGQFIYVYNSGNSWTKFMLSGNNATNVGTWIGGINAMPQMIYFENNRVYMMDTDRMMSVYDLSGNLIIQKSIRNFYEGTNPKGTIYVDNQIAYSLSSVAYEAPNTSTTFFMLILTPISIN